MIQLYNQQKYQSKPLIIQNVEYEPHADTCIYVGPVTTIMPIGCEKKLTLNVSSEKRPLKRYLEVFLVISKL